MPKLILYTILFLSILLMSYGGLMDMRENQWKITPQHAWSDGIYLCLLLILISLIQ